MRFAREALWLARVRDHARVLDVATGFGTLAFEAARQGARAVAVDFADEMVAHLRARLAGERVAVRACRMDGQHLAFRDATFHAVFSMFGLMYFRSRSAGLRELLRVLRPGGRAVVGTWVASENEPLWTMAADALTVIAPGWRPTELRILDNPALLRRALRRAGFVDVDVQEAWHPIWFRSLSSTGTR